MNCNCAKFSRLHNDKVYNTRDNIHALHGIRFIAGNMGSGKKNRWSGQKDGRCSVELYRRRALPCEVELQSPARVPISQDILTDYSSPLLDDMRFTNFQTIHNMIWAENVRESFVPERKQTRSEKTVSPIGFSIWLANWETANKNWLQRAFNAR